jgi:cryptochrome
MSASTSASTGAVMHWFRKGLRLHDNPALLHALSLVNGNNSTKGGAIYPVYVVDPNSYSLVKCSVMRAKFLLECVKDLDNSLRERGSRLYVVTGDPVEELPKLWKEFGITHMTHEADETGEPYAVERDANVKDAAKKAGVSVMDFASETLRPLGNREGGYVANVGGFANNIPTTMSSFQKLLSRIDRGSIPLPLESPGRDKFPKQAANDSLDAKYRPLEHPCDIPWPRGYSRNEIGPVWDRKTADKKISPIVKGGESLALTQLQKTVTARPDWSASFEKPKTSCTEVSSPSTTVLSPYLSVGCISPRTVWHAVSDANARASSKTSRSKPPVSLHGQLLWRDFNNLIAHSANAQAPGSWGQMQGNPYCRNIPWSSDPALLTAWKEGRTGYPWIDACMAQLRTEGWIHHLGRHAVACFLTRGDLWQSWEVGAEVFEGELLDADYALNNFNWLWLSCSGFFYQYFRCYSPVAFQKKNDPNGNYIRKWVPELAELPAKYIYEPWTANVSILKKAGVKLGVDYPRPIVDHAVVSKENMSKMSLAYDMHKDAEAAAKKGKGKPTSGDADDPPKKKAKKSVQTKLK